MPAREPSPTPAAARRRVLALLQADHRAIAAAFAAVEALPHATSPESMRPLIDAALALLERHARMEEDAFYPAIRPLAGERVDEAEVEHASMASLVAALRSGGPADPKYVARFKVLGEYQRHHAAEEQAGLFTRLARAALPWVEIEARIAARHPPPAARKAPARKRRPPGDQKL